MAEHRSRGTVLEYDATVEEIQDNMNSILGKVNFKANLHFGQAMGGWMITMSNLPFCSSSTLFPPKQFHIYLLIPFNSKYKPNSSIIMDALQLNTIIPYPPISHYCIQKEVFVLFQCHMVSTTKLHHCWSIVNVFHADVFLIFVKYCPLDSISQYNP